MQLTLGQKIRELRRRDGRTQEALAEAIKNRDMDAIFSAFIGDPLVTCNVSDARKLFDEMVENTKAYLKDYNL